MHGSSYTGDCAQALLDLDSVMKETLGTPPGRIASAERHALP
jgi:hypothetical protein